MTTKRMDPVSVIVDDLPAAVAFFTTLGMAVEGQMLVEGPWVDRLDRLEGVLRGPAGIIVALAEGLS
jgi:catechol 2,3-dioxygenase-like lactoylglutathione lyase family enzyme